MGELGRFEVAVLAEFLPLQDGGAHPLEDHFRLLSAFLIEIFVVYIEDVSVLFVDVFEDLKELHEVDFDLYFGGV
jgi:hypothetical protein